jgi:hypothetical protein
MAQIEKISRAKLPLDARGRKLIVCTSDRREVAMCESARVGLIGLNSPAVELILKVSMVVAISHGARCV